MSYKHRKTGKRQEAHTHTKKEDKKKKRQDQEKKKQKEEREIGDAQKKIIITLKRFLEILTFAELQESICWS